jgi:mono/diheme cytochrome c family protein
VVFFSRADCKACHTHAGGFVLSVNTRQLNRSHGVGDDGLNQLAAWEQAGMFKQTLPASPSEPDAYPDWEREEGAIESLAHAYLDVNCSFCHTPGGPGNSPIDLAYHTPLERAVLIDVPPRGTRTGGPPATA